MEDKSVPDFLSPEEGLERLKCEITKFCQNLVPNGDVCKKDKGKIIHDSTWKTNYFEPYEIEIIHSPLFQRLRHISQMGFVDYVYPSARHSRFEHSLGVTVIASKMINAVIQNSQRRDDQTAIEILNENVRMSVRMSALLHDVGHCLYSHTSELVYGSELVTLMACEFPDGKTKPSPHEFLSYLIVQSPPFSSYFEKIKSAYGLSIDLNEIAYRIVGRTHSHSNNEYSTNIIAGPLDADKLDYFYRDSQFSGIPIQLDIDRLLHELGISQIDSSNILTVSEAGVTCIEQMIFNKMLLYSTIYTHHKVEAIDCMFRGVFEYIIDNNMPINIDGTRRELHSAADFLHLVDYHLFALADETEDMELKRLINDIKNRRLLKRAFLITRKTINQSDNWAGIIKLVHQGVSESERNNHLRQLACKIWSRAEVSCSKYEVWIDIPKSPMSKEISTVKVRSRKSPHECEGIEKFYPLVQYNDLYELNRLNGYVFAPEYCREKIAVAAKSVLEEELGITFNETASVH